MNDPKNSRVPIIHIDETPTFKVGDPCPDGYIDRQEWAEVQMKAGLKQEQCGRCSRWKFPFEMSDHVDSMKCMTALGEPHVLTWKVCIGCLTAKENHESSSRL